MPECGYCKDCRHWTNETNVLFRRSSLPVQSQMVCALTEHGLDNELPRLPQAFALDFEGYEASLVTAPDFGCLSFEPKET